MRFAVFTHVIHTQVREDYFAYAPYMREMNLWIKNADKVEILAPLQLGKVPGKKLKYIHSNLQFNKLVSFNLLSLAGVLRSILVFPLIFYKVARAMQRADHLHIRCPGNVGLIACIAQIFFPRKLKTAKYAGNWDPASNQPWSYKLQRWILKNNFLTKNINVLVYGTWDMDNKNIMPFYTASFSEKDKGYLKKEFAAPLKFIFVGNLVEGKGVVQAIQFIEKIRKEGYSCSLEIFGDGVLESDLREYLHANQLTHFVKLRGRRDLNELQKAYKFSHFIILLSRSEGWPKAIAEGMWFGCVPIASKVSCIPWMLGAGDRGFILDNRISDQKIEDFKYLLNNPERLERMSRNSIEWAQKYTLEGFERDIKKFL